MFRSQEIILRECVCTLLKSLNYLKVFKNIRIAATTPELTVEILNSVF